MAPTPPKQPRYYNLYNDAYLMSHQQRLEYSFGLAQQELKTKLQLIEFYEKRAADLRKANTGSEFSKLITYYKLEHSVDKQYQDRVDRVAREVEDDFDISRVDVAGLGQAMRADMRAGASYDKAIRNVMGTVGSQGRSELQRIVIAKAILGQAQTQAKALSKPFDVGNARAEIGRGMGITPAKMLLSDTDLKTEEYNRRIASKGLTIKSSDMAALKKKIASDTNAADALQSKSDEIMKSITDTYGDDINLENLVERGREIYNRQFAPMNRQQKKMYAQSKLLDSMSPKAQLIYSGLNDLNPEDARIGKLTEGSADIPTAIAYQLLEDKLAGRDTDMVAFARDYAQKAGVKKEKEQEIIEESLALAFRSYQAQLPEKESRLKRAVRSMSDEETKPKKDPMVEQSKKEAFMGFMKSLGEGINLDDFDELFSGRIKSRDKIPTSPEMVEMGVDEKQTEKPEATEEEGLKEPDEIPVEEIPKPPDDTPPVVVPEGPEFNKTYYKGNDPTSFGYQFIDADNVTFIKKDGSKVGKFGKDTAQYTEALEYYEASKGK